MTDALGVKQVVELFHDPAYHIIFEVIKNREREAMYVFRIHGFFPALVAVFACV
jgi:hypothetical protein